MLPLLLKLCFAPSSDLRSFVGGWPPLLPGPALFLFTIWLIAQPAPFWAKLVLLAELCDLSLCTEPMLTWSLLSGFDCRCCWDFLLLSLALEDGSGPNASTVDFAPFVGGGPPEEQVVEWALHRGCLPRFGLGDDVGDVCIPLVEWTAVLVGLVFSASFDSRLLAVVCAKSSFDDLFSSLQNRVMK